VILVPVVGKFLYFGVNLWAILATILAIRDALQVSTRRALGISLASLVVLTTLGMGLAAGAMAAGWQPFAP
jgi:energy-coupling factor transporter transmembrane protein EcfT